MWFAQAEATASAEERPRRSLIAPSLTFSRLNMTPRAL
jgi:hypothetical protein